MDEDRCKLQSSVQRALVGAVSATLRGVTCSSRQDIIVIRFIFDGEISDEAREAASEVEAEVLADFPTSCVEIECVRHDVPAILRQLTLDWWAFARREYGDSPSKSTIRT
jgi:hypothetical protein